jgi:hypothetical protein
MLEQRESNTTRGKNLNDESKNRAKQEAKLGR